MSDIQEGSLIETSEIAKKVGAPSPETCLDVPLYRADPSAFLPLNSALINDQVMKAFSELEMIIEEEKKEVVKLQRQISVWEERIKGNFFQMGKHSDQIKQNTVDAFYEVKNRDYWWGREALVLADFSQAQASSCPHMWAWLIKKYGLKNPDGTPLDHKAGCVEELCNGAIRNLAQEYKEEGIRYDVAQANRNAENVHLVNVNAKLSATNEHLRNYIANAHAAEITPVQDGVLFLKEFALKLKSLERQETPANFGDMRAWAEHFLDDFLKKYPSIPHRVVGAFRKIASIPLPAQNS